MTVVYLISCTKAKLNCKCEAEKIYSASPLFKLSLQYAKNRADKKNIFVLSAKFGLLPLDEVIEPYNQTLKDAARSVKKVWSRKVEAQLAKSFDLNGTRFVILAGKDYWGELNLPNMQLPLCGMPQGVRMQWLKRNAKC